MTLPHDAQAPCTSSSTSSTKDSAEPKYCPGCRRLLRVIVNTTFNKKTDSPDGLQPYCRECDTRQKGQRGKAWAKFVAELRRRDQNELHRFGWTEAKYQAVFGRDWECRYCGAEVDRYGGSYWLDRVDSDRGYEPNNVVPCCWGCNRAKSNKHPEVFANEVRRYVEHYGRGSVPWQKISPQIHLRKILDLSLYEVEPSQLNLFNTPEAAE